MEGGECRGGLSNVLDDEDELHVDALRSGSESDEEVWYDFICCYALFSTIHNLTISTIIFMKQADSTGVRQAKDTVGWIKEAMVVLLYDASFSAHFSLDGPKIDSDNGSEESEGHYDDVSRLSWSVWSFFIIACGYSSHIHLFLPDVTGNRH